MESRRICLQGNSGEIDTANRLWTWGEGRGGEMCRKSNVETYIMICKIDSQRKFAL